MNTNKHCISNATLQFDKSRKRKENLKRKKLLAYDRLSGAQFSSLLLERPASMVSQPIRSQCTFSPFPENMRQPKVFSCFQGVEKGCTGNEWVN